MGHKKTWIFLLAAVLLMGCKSGGEAKKITQISDISNMKIGVITGGASVIYLEAKYPDAELMQFNGVVDILAAVKAKKVDCGIFDDTEMRPIVKEDTAVGQYPELLTEEEYAAAVKKGNTKLLEELDAYFEEANQDGSIVELLDRWEVEGNYTMPDIPLTGERGVITVGIANNLGFPTVGMIEDKIVGTSPEIAYRFAQRCGYDLKISFMEFGGLMPALQSGKIDFAISNITITPERAEQVDFAVPYDGGGLAILALKERLP